MSNTKEKAGTLRVLMSLMVCLVMLFGVFGSQSIAKASADDDSLNSMVSLVKGDRVLASYADRINIAIRHDEDIKADFNLLTYDSQNGTMEFNNKEYEKLDLKSKRKVMKIALDAVGSSSLSSAVKMKLYNFIADQDTGVSQAIRTLSSDANADVASAMGWLAPYYGVFATIWGLLCILILILMAFGTTVDLLYLTVPLARTVLTNNKTGKPWCVSHEAYNASKKDEDSGGKENYMITYLRTRFITFLVMGTIIVMIVTGTIWEPFLYFGSAFTS